MKKILFSLAAVLVMVCTALSFTSCNDGDTFERGLCKVQLVNVFNGGYNTSLTQSLDDKISSRVNDLVGNEVNLAKDDSGKPTDAAIASVATTLSNDSQLNSLIDQLFQVKNGSKYAVSEVLLYVWYGSGTNDYKRATFRSNLN